MEPKIIIAKPCHENWNKMTTEEQGRHCAVCSKVVKDFTAMKTNDIVNSLKYTDGEVCGRINVKQLTPINKKQKVYFWINGVLFRKAIYPIMALLGVTLVSKKAVAQTDYPVKGKVAYNDYHTSAKKITVVVKTIYGNNTISGAGIRIVSGVKNHPEILTTDANGRVSLSLDASDLIGEMIEIEISAIGYEHKKAEIKIVKDIQTIEIKMEEEMMIMGEMMIMPQEKVPEVKNVNEKDTMEKIQVTKCSITTVESLPQIKEDVIGFEIIERFLSNDTNSIADDNIHSESVVEQVVNSSSFDVFPVPSFDHVNIVSNIPENFNVDIYDGNGKKIHSVVNSNSRYALDVSNYSAGIYYVLLTVGGKAVETKKIIVSK